MGCSRACDEGHTYQEGCAMRAVAVADTPAYRPGGPIRRHIDQCANLLCVNLAHEGQFVMVAVPGQRNPVALALCAPCGETVMGGVR